MKAYNLFGKRAKLQSAMEYLITYGWAILILAIVLSLLFALGIFSNNNNTNLCVINQGFGCLNYYMNTNGIAVLTITQTTATYINITGIGCSSDSNNEHIIAPQTASQQVYLAYGSAYNFTVQCYTASGIPSLSVGRTFYGSVYINYINDVTGFPGSATGKLIITPSISGTISSSSEVLAYLPVMITNDQSTPVPSGFQQMIYFNPSLSEYSSNEMLNLSNIEFTTSPDGVGTPINTWIESGASSSSTNTVLWVSLPQGIASNGGTETIYMNFLNNNAPVTNGYTGYAPQQWCASGCFQTEYGEYDNGASIFSNYWNFSGTTLNSAWTSTGANVIVDNGLSIGMSSSIYTNMVFNSMTTMIDTYASFNSLIANCNLNFGPSSGSVCSEIGYLWWDGAWINPAYSNTYYLLSFYSPSATTMVGENSYSNFKTVPYGNNNQIVFNGWGAGTNTLLADWARTRAVPPNGVMPSFTLGNPTR